MIGKVPKRRAFAEATDMLPQGEQFGTENTVYGSKNAMSFHLNIIAYSNDRAAALADLRAHFEGRAGYEKGANWYSLVAGQSEEGFLVELYESSDVSGSDPEFEEDPRTLGWVAINFFRSKPFYQATGRELQALLDTEKFFLYDEGNDETFKRTFPVLQFVNEMSDIQLEDLEDILDD